jgi:hypothetical protein
MALFPAAVSHCPDRRTSLDFRPVYLDNHAITHHAITHHAARGGVGIAHAVPQSRFNELMNMNVMTTCGPTRMKCAVTPL